MADPVDRDALNPKKPEPLPPAVEPDEDEGEPKSHLSSEVADREAKKAIQEIEEEIEEEHPTRPATPPPRGHRGNESFIDRAWQKQYELEARLKSVGHGRYARVVKMARKPEEEEYRKALQITGIGILVIGAVGFLIYLGMQWIQNLLGVK